MYSHTRVTTRPNAPNHSMYLGAPASAPDSMKSKSSTRLSAATTTTTALKPIPRDRKSVVSGKSVFVRVDLGGRRRLKKKKKHNTDMLRIPNNKEQIKPAQTTREQKTQK